MKKDLNKKIEKLKLNDVPVESIIHCDDCNKYYDATEKLFGDLHLVEDSTKDWSIYFNKNELLCEPCIEKRFK